MRVLGPCVAALWAFLVPQAMAQNAQDKAIDSAIACRSIADPTERLACLDKAANAIAETRIIRDDPTAVEQSPAQGMTGFGAPKSSAAPTSDPSSGASRPDEFGKEYLKSERRAKAAERKSQRLEAKIVEARINPYKRVTITLDNGQVWQQLNSDDVSVRLKDGKLYTAVIKRGPLGNYRMTIKEDKTTLRMRRIR